MKSASVPGSYDEGIWDCYFDVPATATAITDISLQVPNFGKSYTVRNNFPSVFTSISLEGTSCKYLCSTVGFDKRTESFDSCYFENSSFNYQSPEILVTMLEGLYSCSNSNVNGYPCINYFKNYYEFYYENPMDYTLDDISGYEYDDGTGTKTTRVTMANKIAMLDAMNNGTYGSALAVSSASSTANSFIWTVAIATVAAIASVTVVVITGSKKKQKSE